MNIVTLIHNFHLLRPLWLIALPLLWMLVLVLARRSRNGGDWSQIIDAELLPALRLDTVRVAGMRPWPWLALLLSLVVLALSGPSWERIQTAAYRVPADWVFILDLSPSMMASDVAPNRATRARYALDDLLGAAHDARVGLVVFSDEPYTVAPLTQDIATIKTLLPPLSPDIMPSPGDHLAPALNPAEKLLQENEPQEQQSDGDPGPPGTEAALEGDEGLDHPLDQDPEQGSGHEADPAGDQGAADDHRGDGIELEPTAGQPIGGAGVHGVDDPPEGRTESREHIDQDPGPGHR